jgi:VanZ family protein
MLLITYWSHQPTLPIDQPEVKQLFFGLQHRLAHLVGFGVLGLLALWTFQGAPRAALLAVLFTSAFGAFDEWHQSLVPGRKPGIDDWLFDTFSAALAIYTWSRLRLRPHSSTSRYSSSVSPTILSIEK